MAMLVVIVGACRCKKHKFVEKLAGTTCEGALRIKHLKVSVCSEVIISVRDRVLYKRIEWVGFFSVMKTSNLLSAKLLHHHTT